jgi:ubiquinone/menaquinone biosynthesis C-methylase UbiE
MTPLELFNMSAAKYDVSTAGMSRELARHLVDISPPFSAESQLLDNACGTGHVAQEVLLNRFAAGEASPKIVCADGAPAMVDIARTSCEAIIRTRGTSSVEGKPSDQYHVTYDVMNSQDLQFPSDHFTHSITSLGVMFFMDPAKGTGEIYRTLKPGGTAIVTSWATLGHVTAVQEAQKVFQPGAPLMQFPIPPQWYQASYLEKLLRDAGFSEVRVHEATVHFAVETLDKMCVMLLAMYAQFCPAYKESESVEFVKHLRVVVEKVAVKIERVVAGETADTTEQLFGIPLNALVAVAKK